MKHIKFILLLIGASLISCDSGIVSDSGETADSAFDTFNGFDSELNNRAASDYDAFYGIITNPTATAAGDDCDECLLPFIQQLDEPFCAQAPLYEYGQEEDGLGTQCCCKVEIVGYGRGPYPGQENLIGLWIFDNERNGEVDNAIGYYYDILIKKNNETKFMMTGTQNIGESVTAPRDCTQNAYYGSHCDIFNACPGGITITYTKWVEIDDGIVRYAEICDEERLKIIWQGCPRGCP